MNTPKCFLSYSSFDSAMVAAIIDSLKHSGVTLWDYTDPEERIAAGTALSPALSSKIDECDYFILFISRNTLDPDNGKFVLWELEYAVVHDMLSGDRIIPVLLDDTPVSNAWPAPLDQLVDIVNISVPPPTAQRAFFEAIGLLCLRIGVKYKPVVEPHPRLPVHQRLIEEIFAFTTLPYEHNRLMNILAEFSSEFNKGEYEQARFLIRYLIDSCRYIQPQRPVYYPQIVKAVCEQSMGLLEESKQSYTKATDHPKVNESAWDGLGSVCAAMGDHVAAYSCYQKALEMAPSSNNTDERINCLMARLALNLPVAESDVAFLHGIDVEKLPVEGQRAVANAIGASYYQRGEYQKAAAVFSSMIEKKIHDSGTVVYLHGSYAGLSNRQKAVEVLRQGLADPVLENDPGRSELAHRLNAFVL